MSRTFTLALLLATSTASAARHAVQSPAIATAVAKVESAKVALKTARKALADAKKASRAARKTRAKQVTAELVDEDGNDMPDAEDVCRAIARPGETWEDACHRVTQPHETVETDPAGY